MLTHLTIKNYALIKHMEMDMSAHLNVITGETGAGKSIMLGALGLLLGHRADTKVLWDAASKCITEGTFDIKNYGLEPLFEQEHLDYDHQTTLRREISPSGKSRAFINDTPVTLDVMRKVGVRLMDIHSQHDTLELANRSFQLRVLDAFASNQAIRKEYQQAWAAYVSAKKDYERMEQEALALGKEADFIQFQLDELVKAQLDEGEQDQLEADLKIMEHAEDIKSKINKLLAILDRSEVTATGMLSQARSTLHALGHFATGYKKIADRFDSVAIELADIVNELEREEGKVDFDPEKIAQTQERLSLIYQLLQKHRAGSISELLRLQDELQQKANQADTLDETLAALKLKLEKAHDRVKATGQRLSLSRTAIGDAFCAKMIMLLSELGIPEARVKVAHQQIPHGADGMDSMEFYFSANKGVKESPLAQVASGGEFSRVMFCVKYLLAEKASIPTLVLDEIDTGVSGEIAIRLARLMQAMAAQHQLVAISHLPQIAAKADRHFYAYKDSKAEKTISQIKALNEAERIEEIAKMIGGEKPSALAVENARELIAR